MGGALKATPLDQYHIKRRNFSSTNESSRSQHFSNSPLSEKASIQVSPDLINNNRNSSSQKSLFYPVSIMHFQIYCTAVAALAMSIGPGLALPEPIPVLELESRAQCLPGKHLVGSGCSPGRKGHTSCSADKRAVVSNIVLFA